MKPSESQTTMRCQTQDLQDVAIVAILATHGVIGEVKEIHLDANA